MGQAEWLLVLTCVAYTLPAVWDKVAEWWDLLPDEEDFLESIRQNMWEMQESAERLRSMHIPAMRQSVPRRLTDREVQRLKRGVEELKDCSPCILSSEDMLTTVRPGSMKWAIVETQRKKTPPPLRPFQNCGCFPYHADREILYCLGRCGD